MKVIVCALTGFGNAALRALKKAGITPVALITRKEEGAFPYFEEENISSFADKAGIPVYKDLDLKSAETAEIFSNLSPDLILVATFHDILPQKIVSMPKYGVINVHPSLLPRYRGATPTNWSIIMGEEKIGVTLHFIDKKIDSGDIIAQWPAVIGLNDTDGLLRKKLSILAEEMLYEQILSLKQGKAINSYPQDEKDITYFPKITKRDAFIKFDEPSINIHNRIRGTNPYPGAYSIYAGGEFLIQSSELVNEKFSEVQSGLLIGEKDGFLIVKTKDGALKIKTNLLLDDIKDKLVILGRDISLENTGKERALSKKEIIHTREVYGIEKGAEEFPKMVVVSVTYLCNTKCPHCPYTEENSDLRQRYKDELFISSDLFRKISDECAKFGSFIRITGGGEPLLHKDMVSLIKYAKGKGARVWLNTNGSLFTNKIISELLNCKTDLVEFSVDAADKVTYDKVRPGLDFDKLVENIKHMVNERNRLKLPARIAVSVVNQEIIKDEIEKIKEFWLSLGVDEVIIRKFLTWGSTTTLDPSKSADPTPYLIKEKGDPCPYPFHRLNIDTRGKVEVCGFDIAGRTNFGNVKEQSIQEIWKGPQFSWWRQMHIQRRGGEIPLCRECPDWRYRSWNYNWERVLDTTLMHREEVFKKGAS